MSRKQKRKDIFTPEKKPATKNTIPWTTNKRNLEASASHASPHHDLQPAKRRKIDSEKPLPTTSTSEASSTSDPKSQLTESNDNPTSAVLSLPHEIQHLQDQYHFSTMSIISSSKIHQKVTNLLARVEKSVTASASAKPGVVVVEAKAAAASKMISVVEIAKADIAKHGGTWYQYSRLRSELLLKEKQKKRPQDSRAPANLRGERAMNRDLSIKPQHPQIGDADDQKNGEGEDSEDGAAAFETLQPRPARKTVMEKLKVRATPIMTIYLSCISILGLKDLCG
ncbi:MAG: hypothetical protein Q9181_000281 [Wetmoreana brouardii]